MNNKSGFTLAEIIITLTIVGMVAAISIPAMIQDIQDKQLKTAWKKTFADISQASKRLAADYGGNLSGAFSSGAGEWNDQFRNRFLPYLSYIKLCSVNIPTGPDGCWHNATSFYKLSGSAYNADWSGFSRMVLNNGSLIEFDLFSAACKDNHSPSDNNCGEIRIDINGFEGPNKIGKDIFGLWLLKNGDSVPFGAQGDYWHNLQTDGSCNVKQYSNTSGWGCSAQYLYQ